MKQWVDDHSSPASRLFYRSRAHQAAQLQAAIRHAGDLQGKSVLDVGCGYGDLIPFLPRCRYVGVDPDQEVIETARSLHPGFDFRCTDRIYKTDVVVAVAVLQCCADHELTVRRWMGVARERVVVVSLCWEKLPEEHQDLSWWRGIPHERFEDGDDFFTAVIATSAT